ncbi:hypothetical protein ES332_D02G020500v1 [Gossypium tomentosum]|uniref:DC1 domain-containing protein n=1 Tax=Gossypium tomentosum TaxID=34277 RepID=A0A5D2LSG6_GOSTO|nr:hypothetical protein ES332_D02G020500v1 [Gossypium tomentosum]
MATLAAAWGLTSTKIKVMNILSLYLQRDHHSFVMHVVWKEVILPTYVVHATLWSIKKCTSLPRIIKSKWHDHRLFHKYFLCIEDFRDLDCIMCNYEVITDYGSYYCSECDVIFHVKCAIKNKDSYEIVENEDEESADVSSKTKVLEWNDAGEATVIEHITHIHHLTLSDRVGEYDNKCCDGCLLPISDSFYYCTQCDFFLHKVCVELPKVK